MASLTSAVGVGNVAYMKARLITRFKDITPEGDILELVVWRLPAPVPPCTHDYKYRAVFVVNGERVIGFDNERGKGDHCHLQGQEKPYRLTSVDQLIDDLMIEVERWKNEHSPSR
ncbi:hypothetical protein Thiowin_04618 [Thiorhodovibrio winogradskyi]|uniref:Uncharacterized protein n=2 Tax=Thiorhodovibrio winogradskyi TaxID=77007 RepID=A0ABZ0SF52_9GAMM